VRPERADYFEPFLLTSKRVREAYGRLAEALR